MGNNGKCWQVIGLVATITIFISGTIIAAYYRLSDADTAINEKIKEGDEAVRLELAQKVERMEDKVDKIDDKLDTIHAEQKKIVEDSYKISIDILKQLNDINRKVQ